MSLEPGPDFIILDAGGLELLSGIFFKKKLSRCSHRYLPTLVRQRRIIWNIYLPTYLLISFSVLVGACYHSKPHQFPIGRKVVGTYLPTYYR